MTQLELLDVLELFCTETTKDILLPVNERKNEDITDRAPQVFQEVPKDGEAHAPYISMECLGEEITDDQTECKIRLVFVVYDKDQKDGRRGVLNVLNRVKINLLKQRVLDDRFILKMPMEYIRYDDERTHNYYIADMTTTWELPQIEREIPEWQ